MTWSLGEIRALSFKAARGSGLDWGYAEEASYVVHWLQHRGLSGINALADYVLWRTESNQYKQDADPILLGASILDTKSWQENFPKEVFQPLLVLPSLACILDDACLRITWPEADFTISKDGVYNQRELGPQPRNAVLTEVITTGATEFEGQRTNRAFDNQIEGIKILEKFAALTYAPATEASRSSGAGAGDDGND